MKDLYERSNMKITSPYKVTAYDLYTPTIAGSGYSTQRPGARRVMGEFSLFS